MSNTITVNCEKREALGTSNARRLRREGIVPAVVYAHGSEAVSLAITEAELGKLAGHAGMVTLACSCGNSKLAIIKDVQRHPISTKILHVDFLEVKADEKITVHVDLESTGEAAGLRQGGQLEQVVHELEVECLPADVPEVIVADVSAVELDQAFLVSQLVLPAGVTVLNPADQILFHVRMPRVEAPAETAEPAEGEEAAAAEGAADAKAKEAAPAKK